MKITEYHPKLFSKMRIFFLANKTYLGVTVLEESKTKALRFEHVDDNLPETRMLTNEDIPATIDNGDNSYPVDEFADEGRATIVTEKIVKKCTFLL